MAEPTKTSGQLMLKNTEKMRSILLIAAARKLPTTPGKNSGKSATLHQRGSSRKESDHRAKRTADTRQKTQDHQMILREKHFSNQAIHKERGALIGKD